MAVLRYFVEQRQQELANGIFKNRKGRLAAVAAAAAVGATDGVGSASAPVRQCGTPCVCSVCGDGLGGLCLTVVNAGSGGEGDNLQEACNFTGIRVLLVP